jgi:AcrR family transcriptional regulator
VYASCYVVGVSEVPEVVVLPRGRHNLSREQVRASQRERILLGMLDAVAEQGYAHTSVADVIARAHASRETFYENFANKQDCFLAAYEAGVAELTATLRGAIAPEDPPLVAFERVLTAYLEAMAAKPELAHTFLIEVYAAGPVAWKRRAEVLERFGEVVFEIAIDDASFQRLPDPRFAAQAVVGAISSLVTGRVAAGEYAAIAQLRAPIMQLLETLLAPAASRRPLRVAAGRG